MKIAITRFLGALIPVIILFLYLICNNIWTDFVDYAIKGVTTFSNSSGYLKYINDQGSIQLKIYAIAVPIGVVIMIIIGIISFIKPKLKEKILVNNIYVLLAYSIAGAIVMIPIVDTTHFMVGSMCIFISWIYMIYNFLLSKFRDVLDKDVKYKYGIKVFFSTMSIILLLLSIGKSLHLTYQYIDEASSQIPINHYSYIITSEDVYSMVEEVDEYILKQRTKGKTVYVLDVTSVLFMTSLDIYNKDYDMFNKGNFGSKGEEGLIEDLENTDNLVVLVKQNSYDRNWQNPDEVTSYVENNFTKIDEVYYFDVYSN